ncbi:co-chaperone DjlA [Agarivorans sp. B2Z047]|uniref:co-chaperone DjlA n=1 Tax=Agarivorans sp. B2Z047 TaxID=2652721 RepID=UPI00128D9A58|nr:co-chaperone DjlA [Agarivorans sp. B2Z047]MPW31390.1 co-chaperone DjlA [Agarivorans sp. B2Z047]UQN42434.1 co-chaperone DjlA [Agarivorans sp. B2Z047]
MRIWGKVLGVLFGSMLGNILWVILGLWIGHRFDKATSGSFVFSAAKSQAAQQAFLFSTFAVLGHIAKSKGVVTQQEIQVANFLMDQMRLQGEARRQAQDAFRQGKDADFPLEEQISRFVSAVNGRRDLLQMFMEIQLQGVFADGVIDDSEHALLKRVAKALGFSEAELQAMISRWEAELKFHRHGGQRQSAQSSAKQLEEAYQILGVNQQDSDQQIKRAYRKLMSQHHPDKLVAKGLPPEMMELAKQRTQDIQQAYELVKQQRKSAN